MFFAVKTLQGSDNISLQLKHKHMQYYILINNISAVFPVAFTLVTIEVSETTHAMHNCKKLLLCRYLSAYNKISSRSLTFPYICPII